MKKSTKLLSVILAIVMLFSSMSIMASAAKANYKTVADLEANQAYSPYGAVTRLSTEERMSIVLDYLDNVLSSTNLKGNFDLSILGSLTYDVTSVNGVLGTVDSVKSLLNKNAFLLVTLKDAYSLNQNFDVWQTGMTREKNNQLAIIKELLQLLQNNANVLFNILNRGSLNLGGIGNAIIGGFMDMSSFNAILGDIPGLIKGMIYPLFARWDDTIARADQLANTKGNGGVEATLNEFVQKLFQNDMSITTYVENASGTCVSNHSLPMSTGTRWYFTRETSEQGEYLQLISYDTETKTYITDEANRYFKTLEEQAEDYTGPDRYVFVKTNSDGSKENLKYYKNDSKFLPSFAAALAAGTATLDLTSETPAALLYKFIPYVFAEMEPVVLNGSVKKLFAGLLGAQFTYVGEVGSAEVKALADSNDVFFTQAQGEYLWEWSDYKVINGNHYYRFEDQIYVGDINDVNKYFSLINWDWKVDANAINEFIPGADGSKSAAGYATLFQALNDFVAKVIDIAATPELKAMVNWQKGDNSKLITNIKNAARALLPIEPEIIFGSNYADPDRYYDLIMTGNDQEILIGVACTLLDFLMPQLILPKASAIKGQNVKLGAVLAAVVRELATQFLPTYNYDDLIFENYNNKSFVAGKDNAYWLDVCLTMGVDIGMSYLRNLADLGEDTDVGYKFAASKTYTRASFDQTGWEATVDWILDWALSTEYEWCWGMEKIVNTYEEINLATKQDPWAKVGDVLSSILPISEILNVDVSDPDWAKTALREKLVMGILDLDLTRITGSTEANGIFNIPTSSVLRTTPTLKAVVTVVRNTLNNILTKVAKGDLIPASYSESIRETGASASTTTYKGTFQSLDDIFNQQNLAYLVRQLLIKLYTGVGGDTYNNNPNDISDNGLLDVLLPFANFFLGWSTDAQEFADPTLVFENEGGKPYIYASTATASTTLKITNNSSGMLQKHRNSDKLDKDYVLVIDGISGDFTTTQSFPIKIQPYATASFSASMPYTEERGVKIYLHYHFELKDGTALAANALRSTTYQMVSNREQDATLNTEHKDGVQSSGAFVKVSYAATAKPMNPVVKSAETLASAIANMSFYIVNRRDAETTITKAEYTGFDASYIESNGQIDTLRNQKMSKSSKNGEEDGGSYTVNPAVFKSDVNAATVPSGAVIALGSVNTSVQGSYLGTGTESLTNNYGSLYYMNIDALQTLFENEVKEKRKAAGHTAESWAAYEQAMMNAAVLVLGPVSIAGFSDTYSDAKIDALYHALETAVQGLGESASSAVAGAASVESVLQPVLDACETGDADLNYQDYELYEYWAYEKQRNEARSMISASKKPEAPDAYIEGSALSEQEIRDIAAAESNSRKASAIVNSMRQPTDSELDAYRDQLANWVAPYYSDLKLADIASKLPYYRELMLVNKKATVKQFLTKEIAYAKAQNYNSSLYSADSWAAYTAALATAEKVAADSNALQSTVFDAKYALMVAQNELLLKTKSVKELGLLSNLESLVAQAEIIFNNSQYYAPVAGITEADAYGALIKAVGYTLEDGSILYNRSAAEFLKYDRENTATNMERIKASEAALKAAIDNFECTIKLEEKDENQSTTVTQGTKIIDGITPGTIATVEALMEHVKTSSPDAIATPFASDSGFFGTGAKVEVSVAGIGVLTTYYVVIYGDVNGDGAIDAFDAAVVDQTVNTDAELDGVYKDAAMVTGGDDVALADYSAIFNASVGAQDIAQNRA